MTKSINIFTDGGARGNPGPAAIGVYSEDTNGKKIVGFGKKIGIATNNAAEYKAVISALEWLGKNEDGLGIEAVNFYLDSNLVCSQINGVFKIKNSSLREYLFKIRELESEIKSNIYYSHIPREQNKKADSFVNSVLDS